MQEAEDGPAPGQPVGVTNRPPAVSDGVRIPPDRELEVTSGEAESAQELPEPDAVLAEGSPATENADASPAVEDPPPYVRTWPWQESANEPPERLCVVLRARKAELQMVAEQGPFF